MTKRAQALVAEVRGYCEEHADPAKANKWARYFSEGYDSWGLLDKENPFFTTQRDAWFGKYRAIGLKGFLEAGAELCRSGKYEEASISISFLKEFRGEIDSPALSLLAHWFDDGIRNWAHVDVLCMEVLGPALREGRIGPETLKWWRESEWKYQRRASVVALLPPPKEPRLIPPLLDFVEPLMYDPDKPVQQAVGWLLRDCWKVAPKPVEALLLKHVAAAPRQIYQTATAKMTADQKSRFKRPSRKLR
jgi:3-methyladenine DNA glycosylase AlkD